MKKQTRRRRKKSFSYDDALAVLTEAFSSVSIDHSVSALREADGNPDMAAEILVQALADEEPGSTDTGPTSRSRSRAAFLGPIQSRLLPGRVRWRGFESGCVRNLVSERCFRNKQKRVIASAGTVSNVLGEECVRSKMTKLKAAVDNSQEEAEQFLCSMLGDDSDLNLAVIRDVL